MVAENVSHHAIKLYSKSEEQGLAVLLKIVDDIISCKDSRTRVPPGAKFGIVTLAYRTLFTAPGANPMHRETVSVKGT